MIAPADMELRQRKGGLVRPVEADEVDAPVAAASARPGVRILGGDRTAPGPRSLWSREPWATVRAEPRRFWVGVPIVFLAASGAAFAFREAGLEVALGVLLVAQALGFIGLYVPALRKRTDPLRNRLPPRNDLSPIDLEREGGEGASDAAEDTASARG